ncbi:CBS domain-containing protein [Granulicella sp. WH15]|uniref:CBS domain-containing protein n=1 Tax=Granulicella sp. WH15 TaxID=2602070 RepID=UPI00136714C3|nr:CBS domain-containing protein [Granulicella sp. WH15]QHN04257.1 CBS domain-containing protein [Granulicella sp. WH15]
MRGWSFPIGRVLGVDLRIHTFFVLLCAFSISYATFVGVGTHRGVALWLLLLLAVAVREIARAVAATWFSLELRGILLLPTGGLLTFSPEASVRAQSPAIQRRMAMVGPIANFSFGLIMAAVILTFAPSTDLLSLRWVSPAHLLRALVWVNILLGAINLLPAWPLDGARVFRSELLPAGAGATSRSSRLLAILGPAIALILIAGGMIVVNMWMIIMGITILLGAQMESLPLLQPVTATDDPSQPSVPTGAEAVTMRDVMLTDFTTLSASATLEDAMLHAGHTLQDVYPVVRGNNLVGAVSRQNILEALESNGNSYVQGVMTRSFQTASPNDSLVATLRRIMGTLAGQGAQLVPIVEGERIVGIITPQNLQRSMTTLNQTRRLKQATLASKQNDR